MSFYLGVDLGQAQDYTAVVVIEQRTTGPAGDGQKPRWRYECRHLERLALGTPYPTIVRHLADLSVRPELLAGPLYPTVVDERVALGGRWYTSQRVRDVRPKLVVDATGVGRPVVDMLRAAHLAPVAVSIHGGDTATLDRDWRVPKRDLVGTMQVLLQSGRFKIASALPFARVLTDELLRFRVKIDPLTTHDSYGVWREGGHDDLVLACAVACWYAERAEVRDLDLTGVVRISR